MWAEATKKHVTLLFAALLAVIAAGLIGARALWPGPNLIQNPDFAAGDSGFFSSYYEAFDFCNPGQFAIGRDPARLNFLWRGTTALHPGGEMMIVNGAQEPFMLVWATGPINVRPHHTYYFGVYVTSLFAESPPVLTFRINGVQVGEKFQPAAKVGQWREFYVAWRSVRSSRAAISIVDENTAAYGNDFALDDFSFATSPFPVSAHRGWQNFVGAFDGFSIAPVGTQVPLLLIAFGLFAVCGGLVLVGVSIFRLAMVQRR